jgi:hypothetical protein
MPKSGLGSNSEQQKIWNANPMDTNLYVTQLTQRNTTLRKVSI